MMSTILRVELPGLATLGRDYVGVHIVCLVHEWGSGVLYVLSVYYDSLFSSLSVLMYTYSGHMLYDLVCVAWVRCVNARVLY